MQPSRRSNATRSAAAEDKRATWQLQLPWQRKHSTDTHKDDSSNDRQQRTKRRVRSTHSPPAIPHTVGTGVALAATAYCGVLGAVKGFHTMRRNVLRQMLLDLVPVLEELDVTYWIDFGTLLGIHRDQDLILHDNDVDIAVLNPNWVLLEAFLNKRLARKGYWTKVVRPSEDPDTMWLRLHCWLGMVDIFGTQLDLGGNMASATQSANPTPTVLHQQPRKSDALSATHCAHDQDGNLPNGDDNAQQARATAQHKQVAAHSLGNGTSANCLERTASSSSSCGEPSPRSSACSFSDGASDGQTDEQSDVHDVSATLLAVGRKGDKEQGMKAVEGAMLRVQLGHGDLCDIPAELVLPTTTIEFRGVVMRVPGNVEGALRHRYGPTWNIPRYMDKGTDSIEQQKLYARIFSALGRFGIRL